MVIDEVIEKFTQAGIDITKDQAEKMLEISLAAASIGIRESFFDACIHIIQYPFSTTKEKENDSK